MIKAAVNYTIGRLRFLNLLNEFLHRLGCQLSAQVTIKRWRLSTLKQHPLTVTETTLSLTVTQICLHWTKVTKLSQTLDTTQDTSQHSLTVTQTICRTQWSRVGMPSYSASDHRTEFNCATLIWALGFTCLQQCYDDRPYDMIWYGRFIDLRALESWRDGQLNLAHGPETKNKEKIKIKNRVAQKKRCRKKSVEAVHQHCYWPAYT